jgi:hypothetical protein
MWYCVHSKYLQEVNLAWKRKSDGREQEVTEKLGHSLRLVIDKLFLKGEPVNRLNFIEICQFLGMDWQEIAGLKDVKNPVQPQAKPENSDEAITLFRPTGGISEVDQAINDLVGTLCEMLRRLTRKAGDFLRADRTSIFLLDPQTDVLGTIVAEDGEGGCLLIDVPANRGIVSLAASTLEVINIPFDVYNDPRSEQAKKTDQRTGYRTYSILAWPLLNKQKDLIAVVQLINKLKPHYHPEDHLLQRIDKNGFTAADEEKLAKFAPSILKILEKCQLCYELAQKVRNSSQKSQGSSAIQNAALIAELKRQEQQLRKSLDKMAASQPSKSPARNVVFSSENSI